jgi:putative serine protease PepD
MSAPLWKDRPPGRDHQWMAEPPPPPIVRSLRPEPPPPPPRKRRPWRWVAAALTVAALMLGAVVVENALDANSGPAPIEPLPAATGGRPETTRINQIYAKVSAAVVSVQVQQGTGASSGTGFVIDGEGTVVTNAHVVGNASRVQIRYDDNGEPVEAEVLGTDPSSDLAVLRPGSGAPKISPLPLANSDQVKVGDQAIAIGYPLGLDRTATAGIISGLGREIEAPNGFRIAEVIQTDAPINPGNSGGPLLDARGRVIGVNSQIATAGSQGNVGIGFAVPSNTVRDVVPQLKAGRQVQRPWLGVSTGTPINGSGAAVRQVTPGSPAARVGLRASSTQTGGDGDVIVSVDGKAVNGPDDVAAAIDEHKPGDKIDVEVERNGQQHSYEVTLAQRPDRVP